MKKLMALFLLQSFFNTQAQMIISTGYDRSTNSFYDNSSYCPFDDYWEVTRNGVVQNATVVKGPDWDGKLSTSKWISYECWGQTHGSTFSNNNYDSYTYSTTFNLPEVGQNYSLDIEFYVDNKAVVLVNDVNVNTSSYCQNNCNQTTHNSAMPGTIKIPLNNTILKQGLNKISVLITDYDKQLYTGLTLSAIVNYKSPPCTDCITSFSPQPGNKYILSAWAKEKGAALSTTSYTNPQIFVEYLDAYKTVISSSAAFTPRGTIIDGWQRIEEEFLIPVNAIHINIKLNSVAGDSFFDDIRILPIDGSMKSYVYDPVTLRLSAELDERNYATFYEYDEEGKLVRVKKETERGVMTIKENKNSTRKR